MESVVEKAKTTPTAMHNTVHHVLARSYSFYLFLFIIGVFLDMVFPIRVFLGHLTVQVGIMLIVLSTVLILWAQRTSRDLNKENVTKKTFVGGPYSFTRSPTHWGLFFLTLGFGIMINSFFIILFTVISFLVTRLIFLRREEALLMKKYGAPYIEYKESVGL